jgi:hypothetical protein
MNLFNSRQIKLALALVMILIGCAVAYRIIVDQNSSVDINAGLNGFGVKVGGTGQGDQSGSSADHKVKAVGNGSDKSKEGDGPKPQIINKPGAQFDRLALPKGYVYYSINNDDESTRDGSLARLSADEYPAVENIEIGDILQSTNTKTVRTRPFGASSGKATPRDTCFKVLSGSRKKIIAPAPIKSAAWIPVEIATCPHENVGDL